MSYQKAMKHWKSARRHKLTATRIRGNLLTHVVHGDAARESDTAAKSCRKLRGK